MKAFEARKESVRPQYESVIDEINRAIGWGWKSVHISGTGTGTLYPEVADMISDDGYDIKIVKRADDDNSYNVVSWENAKEGRKGTVTYVDETQPKMRPEDILLEVLGIKKGEAAESEKDEESTDEENEKDSETEK